MGKVNSILKTEEVDEWLSNLKDCKGRAIISARVAAAEMGNFGDCGPVGEGVSEMRISFWAWVPGLLQTRGICCLHIALWRNQGHTEEGHPQGKRDRQTIVNRNQRTWNVPGNGVLNGNQDSSL
jgi:hypothetical protein